MSYAEAEMTKYAGDPIVCIRVPKKIKKRLKMVAEAERTNVSEILRPLINNYLADWGEKYRTDK